VDDHQVFVTAGGNHYHWYHDCEAIRAGQTEAALRGDHVHPIDPSVLKDAIADGRAECPTCRARRGEELEGA